MMSRPFWNSWSIAKLVLLMVLAPLIIVSVILTYYQIDGRLQDMIETLEAEGRIIASHVSDDSEHYLFTRNDEKLQDLIENIAAQENVELVQILDREKNVIVSTKITADKGDINPDLKILAPIIYKDTVVDELEQEIVPLDVVVGWVNMEMSPKIVVENKRSILINSLLILISGLVVSVALAFFISRSLLIPNK